jgi:hypothetical protein
MEAHSISQACEMMKKYEQVKEERAIVKNA